MKRRKVEPYKSKHLIERSSYRLDHDKHIVHLRMLSPDYGHTHVEFFSYTVERGYGQTFTKEIENKALIEMEQRMDEAIKDIVFDWEEINRRRPLYDKIMFLQNGGKDYRKIKKHK